jgi:outer membrane lipoprotein-sorting protein/predicted outer membrane lipoprotein
MRTSNLFLKLGLLVLIVFAVVAALALEQQEPSSTGQQSEPNKAQPTKPEPTKTEQNKAAPSKAESSKDALDRVLRRMDQTAANFHTAQADLIWTTYNSVAEQNLTDKGKIYFRRSGKDIEMAAELLPPSARQIVFAKGKVQVYTPGTGQVDVYDASAHRDEVETFLVLGFGSSGADLRKSFELSYGAKENINGVETDKLELVPLSANIKSRFPKIDLWIDPQGISLRQKLFQEGGDYRLAEYSNPKLNDKLPKNVFNLKTSGSAKTVTH